MRGSTALRGRSHDTHDNLINLLIAVINLAHRDATGDIKGSVRPTAKVSLQKDAILFLQSLDELKAELGDREYKFNL